MGRTKLLAGIGLIASSLVFYSLSILLAMNGYVIASLIGVTTGSMTIIVGADLLKEA